VSTLDGNTRFSIDDEGDNASFCTGDPGFLAAVRGDVDRLNGSEVELRRAMAEASALAMECREEDGSAPTMPEPTPPPALPPAVLAETRAALARVTGAIQRDPSWCFPPDEITRDTGALRFFSDGRVTQTRATVGRVREGHWRLPREGLGDTRIEIVLKPSQDAANIGPRIFHLDVGDSGRLGFEYHDQGGTRREELIPGDGCLRQSSSSFQVPP
jgi:hypothetical protein